MRVPSFRRVLPFVLLSMPASAQWSNDPALNNSIGDGPGDQVQSKMVPTSDGGCYISWFDSIGNGFDVRVQKLDAGGNEAWAHNGVLVADRGFSSTQDYSLDVDASGNAILAYRDDSGVGTQITATQVSPLGALLWSVNLTSTSEFVAAPVVTGTTDGNVVVGWTQNGSTRVQRLDSAGIAQWGTDVIFTPAVGFYSVSDMHAAGNDVIFSMVHQTGSQFFSAKHLVAQKLDLAGAALWGATPVVIFDADSLQVGNFPDFVGDDAGGAVFGWYGTGPLQCYVQHLLSNGSEAFPHNGIAGSSNQSQLRVAPTVSYDSSTGSTFLFWSEKNGSQSQSGVGGQMFDANGNVQWGPNGVTLVGLSSTETAWVTTVASGGGAFAFWKESAAFGQDVLRGAHVNGAGVTDIANFDVASTASGKSRLTAIKSSAGQVLLSWMDARVDVNDIFAQNVNSDGSLGSAASPGNAYCFGVGCPCGNNDALAGCSNSAGSGALLASAGSESASADDLNFTVSAAPANKPVLLFAGVNQTNGLAFGDGLLCTGGGIQRLNVLFSDNNGAAHWGVGIAASQGWVAGDQRNFQTWYRDPSGLCGAGFNTSNAIAIQFQP